MKYLQWKVGVLLVMKIKNKRKILIIVLTIFVLFVGFTAFFITRYQSINAMYPSPRLIKWELSQPFVVNGIKVMGTDFNILDKNEFFKKYSLSAEALKMVDNVDYEQKFMLVTLQLTNISEKDISFGASELMLQASNNWANGSDPLCYKAINPGIDGIPFMGSGETITVTIPFTAIKPQMFEKYWKNYNDLKFSIEITSYPVKNIIILN